MTTSLFDLSPLLRLVGIGMVLAGLPLIWVLWRKRHAQGVGRLQALTLLTLFLTFDLVLFGSFTRLSDSGLGCPDWPGCYGNASPLGAQQHIAAAQSALPDGPVTHSKAWIEMVHRYLASGVGLLIFAMALGAWWLWKNANSKDKTKLLHPGWAALTFVWVCIQGAFGALTVTMKLFPAIVALHLLGGYILLALLVGQAVALSLRERAEPAFAVPQRLRLGMVMALLVLVLQVLSGAWVSTNYAVLACTDFPMCQGQWWPQMDFARGFEIWRPLGLSQDGSPLSFQALTAIHFFHRLLAALTCLVLLVLYWKLRAFPVLRKPAHGLLVLLLLQVLTGLSNVVLGWPLLAAVLHTGGAGALGACLVWLLVASKAPPHFEKQQ
ncbi:MAG: COX15/CtaA family protein [Sulfuritalea sp.]|nr:COX15/CtaA family protein [Sulfuritalea sp.]